MVRISKINTLKAKVEFDSSSNFEKMPQYDSLPMNLAFITHHPNFDNLDYLTLMYQSLQSGIMEEVTHHKIQYSIIKNIQTDKQLQKIIKSSSINACLCDLAWKNHAFHQAWRKLEKNKPCVNVLNKLQDDSPAWYVGSDETLSMQLLVQHLVEEGHRKIGFFARNYSHFSLNRFQGYIQALKHHQLEIQANWIFGFDPKTMTFSDKIFQYHTPRRKEYLSEQTRLGEKLAGEFKRLVDQKDPPEVLMFETGALAFLFLDFAKQQRIRVPEEIAITGFDNIQYYYSPYYRHDFLTTVEQNYFEIGRHAVRIALALFQKKPIPSHSTQHSILIPPKLLRRTSSLKASLHTDQEFKRTFERLIEENYDDPDFSSGIAKYFKLTHKYFLAKFKKNMGRDFTSYLNDYRIQKSTFFLRNTDKPITEIAFGVGYNNLQNFNRLFRLQYHCSPTEYRNKT